MRVSWLLLLILMLPGPALAGDPLPPDVADFLATRKTLAAVTFDAGSASLSAEARGRLDGILAELRQADAEKVIIRVEGFSSRDGDRGSNLLLAMNRARAVESYLAAQDLPDNRTLMGMGVDRWSDLDPAAQRRVEVAIYDNRFGTNDWRADAYLFQ